jgi:3-phosphoshikimate 1-carboxyvinyltransferase
MAALSARGRQLAVHGELRVPGDKSVSHRALIFAALATGVSRIRGILQSADVEATAHVLRAFGVEVPDLAPELTIDAQGVPGLLPPAVNLNCANSGTTARLMMGVAASRPFPSTFTGDVSLSRRPMRRVAAPLTAMGARFDLPEEYDGLPVTVHGATLRGIEWRLESASAQVKSAILLAGTCAVVPVVVEEPVPTRDHTERFLRAQGARVDVEGRRVALHPVERLSPVDVEIPGDPSAAAFFVALGALAGAGELVLRRVALNPGRIGFLAALRDMGARITVEEGAPDGPEPVGDLVVRSGALRAISIGASEVPALIDEIPMLACVAARADGETVVRGASELRVKESDRIAALVANLRAIGVAAEELPDGLIISGTRAPLAGTVQTHGDHRLAMAFGILGALPDCDLAIDDRQCVSVSYPEFWTDLQRVCAS